MGRVETPQYALDGSRLVASEFDPDTETPFSLWFVDGSAEVATFQPTFSPDGAIWHICAIAASGMSWWLWTWQTGEARVGQGSEHAAASLGAGYAHYRLGTHKRRAVLPGESASYDPPEQGGTSQRQITSLLMEQFTHIEQISVSPEGEGSADRAIARAATRNLAPAGQHVAAGSIEPTQSGWNGLGAATSAGLLAILRWCHGVWHLLRPNQSQLQR